MRGSEPTGWERPARTHPRSSPPAPSWAGQRAPGPALPSAHFSWSHGEQQLGVASGERTGGREVRATFTGFFWAAHPARPAREDGSPVRGPGSRREWWGGAARGLRADRMAQNGSTRSKQYRSLTQEARGGSAPAIERSGDTKEAWRNFFRPSRPPSAGTAPRALPPSAAQQPRGGQRPPRARSPVACPGGSHFQEFPRSVRSSSRRIPPASRLPRRRAAALRRAPRRPAPLCVAAARRAPPGGVEPEAVRGSGRPDR